MESFRASMVRQEEVLSCWKFEIKMRMLWTVWEDLRDCGSWSVDWDEISIELWDCKIRRASVALKSLRKASWKALKIVEQSWWTGESKINRNLETLPSANLYDSSLFRELLAMHVKSQACDVGGMNPSPLCNGDVDQFYVFEYNFSVADFECWTCTNPSRKCHKVSLSLDLTIIVIPAQLLIHMKSENLQTFPWPTFSGNFKILFRCPSHWDCNFKVWITQTFLSISSLHQKVSSSQKFIQISLPIPSLSCHLTSLPCPCCSREDLKRRKVFK